MPRKLCQPRPQEDQEEQHEEQQQEEEGGQEQQEESKLDSIDMQKVELEQFARLKNSYKDIIKQQCRHMLSNVQENHGSVQTWLLIFNDSGSNVNFQDNHKTISEKNELDINGLFQISEQLLMIRVRKRLAYKRFEFLEDFGIVCIQCNKSFESVKQSIRQQEILQCNNKNKRRNSFNSSDSSSQSEVIPHKNQKQKQKQKNKKQEELLIQLQIDNAISKQKLFDHQLQLIDIQKEKEQLLLENEKLRNQILKNELQQQQPQHNPHPHPHPQKYQKVATAAAIVAQNDNDDDIAGFTRSQIKQQNKLLQN